jgi:hypothetical protein
MEAARQRVNRPIQNQIGNLNDYINLPDLTAEPVWDQRRQGVQYVVGQGPYTPVLRPLKQTLFSRMTARHGTTQMHGFQYTVGQADHNGVHMTRGDTNMTQAGMLGTPLEYDLVSVGVHPYGAGQEYKDKWERFLNYNPDFTWVFGANTPWVRVAIGMMDIKFPFMTASQLNEARNTAPEFPAILRQIALDMVLPRTVSMTTPDRRARRIQSVESFRAEISFPRQAWSEPYDFSVYAAMHGILYAQL